MDNVATREQVINELSDVMAIIDDRYSPGMLATFQKQDQRFLGSIDRLILAGRYKQASTLIKEYLNFWLKNCG